MLARLLALSALIVTTGCAHVPEPRLSSSECNDWRRDSLEQYEDHLEAVASRPIWNILGIIADHRETKKIRQRIATEEREYHAEMREYQRQRVAYERQRQRDLGGETVLQTRAGIDIRQKMQYKRPRVDLKKLKKIVEDQEKRQKQIERERQQLKRDDERRREQLKATGRSCGSCGSCDCTCPPPVPRAPIREPLRDVPTTIPLIVEADLELQFNDSGYERAEVTRLPPPREPYREPLRCDDTQTQSSEVPPIPKPIAETPEFERSNQKKKRTPKEKSSPSVLDSLLKIFKPSEPDKQKKKPEPKGAAVVGPPVVAPLAAHRLPPIAPPSTSVVVR